MSAYTTSVCNTLEKLRRSASCVASVDLPTHADPPMTSTSGILWW